MAQTKFSDSSQKITLFNSKEDKFFSGSVVFNRRQQSKLQVTSNKKQEISIETKDSSNLGFLIMKGKEERVKEKVEAGNGKWEVFDIESLKSRIQGISFQNLISHIPSQEFKGLLDSAVSKLKEPWFLPTLVPVYQQTAVLVNRTTHSKLFLNLAALCLVISLVSMTTLLLPLALGEFQYRFKSNSQPKVTENIIPENSYLRTTVHSSEGEKIPSEITEFKIIIPKINLESEVIGNVDPNSELDYETKLKYGVAHALGSYLPGGKGPVYLFAHSTDTIFNITRFNAKFFAVKELEIGDEVEVLFNGKKYTYIISERQIIKPDQLDIIQESKHNLILQTCWPPGTNWERLIVFAELKNP